MEREEAGGSRRSNAEWVRELRDGRGAIQHAAFSDLGRFLRFYIFNDVRRRAASLPALASFGQPDLEAVADDIVQEALIRIYNNLDQFTGSGKFLNFALVVARRILIDEFRKKHWTNVPLAPQREAGQEHEAGDLPATLEDLPDPKQLASDAGAMLREMAQIAYTAIQQDLSQNQAYAFIATYFRNLSGEEVAQRMGKRRSAVDQLTFQAREKIKRRLREHGYDIADLDTM